MCKIDFDAAELVKQYRGDRGIVEAEPCQKCLKLGVQNPVYFYPDIGKSKRRGRCFSCYHIEKNKPTSQPTEFIEMPNGDKVFEGRQCSKCQTKLHVFDDETAKRLGLTGSRKRGCYKCALMKQDAAKPVAARRDFLEDVKKSVWKFNIRSVEQSGYVEVVARDAAERAQIKQLLATAMMMNRHAEIAGLTDRYEVDHIYPAAGKADKRGMTNIDNLRIIRSIDNRSKKDSIPVKYQDSQVLDIHGLRKIAGYMAASEALKRWIDEGEQCSDYTPERKAVYTRRQAALKAEIEEIESRLGDDFCRAVYAAVDEQNTSLFDVLTVAQNKLKRFKINGNKKLVENYRRRLELHGNRGFVKVEKPDLADMAFINGGAVLWAVEATLSNVLDGITILMERGVTEAEQRMIDAITYDCIGWAIDAMESRKAEVMPFISPLLGVFGEKIFAVKQRGGDFCLTVYANDVKGRTQKMLDDGALKPFDNDPTGEQILSAGDADVLERMSLFDNETLSIQRQKEAAANARAEAIQSIQKKAGELHKAAGDVLGLLDKEWCRLVDEFQANYLDGAADAEERAEIMRVFTENRKPPFDREAEKQREFMAMCREFIRVPFSDPREAKECYQTLAMKQPPAYIPSIAQDDRPLTLEEQERQKQELERRRVIDARWQKADAEKAERRKAEQAERQKKAAWLRSPAGQKWLSERNQPNRAGVKNLVYGGVSRDNRK
ncbi:hypothetical protein R4852_004713 [Salmonella enterica]|nr:hypothetical protein [Salmonella enterica]